MFRFSTLELHSKNVLVLQHIFLKRNRDKLAVLYDVNTYHINITHTYVIQSLTARIFIFKIRPSQAIVIESQRLVVKSMCQ